MDELESELRRLLQDVRACRVCERDLPLDPRPVVRARPSAKILIVGQAPGTRVHETGVPWNDPSGDRLRAWLDLDRDAFYDEDKIAIVPMAFCYPGRDSKGGGASGGDRPPRPECAPLWHDKILALLPSLALILLVGTYAHRRYLGPRAQARMTDTVQAWTRVHPPYWPVPHPSWRNTGWLRANPWFERDVLPALRRRVADVLGSSAPKSRTLQKPSPDEQ